MASLLRHHCPLLMVGSFVALGQCRVASRRAAREGCGVITTAVCTERLAGVRAQLVDVRSGADLAAARGATYRRCVAEAHAVVALYRRLNIRRDREDVKTERYCFGHLHVRPENQYDAVFGSCGRQSVIQAHIGDLAPNVDDTSFCEAVQKLVVRIAERNAGDFSNVLDVPARNTCLHRHIGNGGDQQQPHGGLGGRRSDGEEA